MSAIRSAGYFAIGLGYSHIILPVNNHPGVTTSYHAIYTYPALRKCGMGGPPQTMEGVAADYCNHLHQLLDLG